MKTIDYQKFKLLKTNRKITKAHVLKLEKSMQKYGFLNSKPITVNSKFEIIDGQHRFIAASNLNLILSYEIDNVNCDDAMIVVNTTSNIWRLNEFIEHYSSKNITEFLELKKLIDTTDYGTSNCISIYGGFSLKPTHIRNGNIIFKNSKLNETIELIEFFRGKLKFFKTNKFVESIVNLVNRKDITSKHLDRLKLNAYTIVECANHTQYTLQYNKIMKIKD
jgi:hypothetical protein